MKDQYLLIINQKTGEKLTFQHDADFQAYLLKNDREKWLKPYEAIKDTYKVYTYQSYKMNV
jgi:hypothetical protein